MTLTNLQPGGIYSMPIYVRVLPGNSLAGFQFRAVLTPEGNAPAPGQISFVAASGFASPQQLGGLAPNDVLCAWSIGALAESLTESNCIGSIQFQVPSNAQAGQCYTLHFIGPDGAADLNTQYDLESFPASAWVLSAAAKPAEIVSDEWKMHFFGSLTKPSADTYADPDHDGVPNWQEFLAGTDPTNALSRLQFIKPGLESMGAAGITLRWLTAPDKTYAIERASNLSGAGWINVTNITGDGYEQQVTDGTAGAQAQFYRIRLLP
jgi:hypothetical protein